ncbi:glycerophosphodiester phosphodiesterase family protein [Microbacterium sp. A94]|uniref:glycerophosphodiester phosphodiesterase family protein n=1 Tax=Microbacterium sp. A94 TaxID=3450717 RepID=UPI003F43751B
MLARCTSRRFIAHRGVHLGSTIAGENSLEAVRLARRAGFACIETDVRLTSDGVAVVLHDESLNRTMTTKSGHDLDALVLISEVPFARLRSDYRLRARKHEDRMRIPTLEEYLAECASARLLPFIEAKPVEHASALCTCIRARISRSRPRPGHASAASSSISSSPAMPRCGSARKHSALPVLSRGASDIKCCWMRGRHHSPSPPRRRASSVGSRS